MVAGNYTAVKNKYEIINKKLATYYGNCNVCKKESAK